MGAYVLRRLAYGAGVVLGVLFLLFLLFFTAVSYTHLTLPTKA